MPTSTRNKNDDTLVIEPNEAQMFSREGLDRKGIRREFASVQALALDDLYEERGDVNFADPRTLDAPYGPTGMGETGGSGMRTLKVDGERWKTFRYAAGYQIEAEDVTNPQLQRDAILEQFDFFADANWLKGVEDQDGTQIRQGMFNWLNANIPSSRVLDCENFDGDSGDEDYTGTPEDLFGKDMYENADFRILDPNSPKWDLMLGRKEALSNFNKRSGSEGGNPGETYWERINGDEYIAGVNNRATIPETLTLDTLPDSVNYDPVTVDLSTELGTDEVYIFPDMDAVRENYWRLSEMPTPETYESDGRAGKSFVDYVWRYSHKFDPGTRYSNAPDAFKLTNVSALFA